MISVEEDFNNQVDRMIFSVGISQLPSPDSPVIVNGFINKVHMVSGMEVMHGLSNIDFHSSVLSWLWSLPAAEINIETLI